MKCCQLVAVDIDNSNPLLPSKFIAQQSDVESILPNEHASMRLKTFDWGIEYTYMTWYVTEKIKMERYRYREGAEQYIKNAKGLDVLDRTAGEIDSQFLRQT